MGRLENHLMMRGASGITRSCHAPPAR